MKRLADEATRLLSSCVAEGYSKCKGPEAFEWVSHKARHSFGVAFALRRISEIKPADWEFRDLAETSCLLHDVGRFYEHDGVSVITGFDHGKAGAGIVRKSGKFPKEVELAVKYHSVRNHNEIFSDADFLSLDDAGRFRAESLLKMVRDADKLENVDYAFSSAGIRTFFTIGGKSEISGFSKDMLSAFAAGNKTTLPRAMVRTEADKMLSMASWGYDLNYSESVSVFFVECLRPIIEALSKTPASPSETAMLKKGLQFLNEHLHERTVATKMGNRIRLP